MQHIILLEFLNLRNFFGTKKEHRNSSVLYEFRLVELQNKSNEKSQKILTYNTPLDLIICHTFLFSHY